MGRRLPDVQKSLGASAGNSWSRDGFALQIESSPRGRITRFTVRAAQPLREGDKNEFLQRLKLEENNANYALEWLENESDVRRFDGVQVVPAPKNYTVILKLSGSTKMVWVRFAPAPPGGDNSLTIPPWDTQISAQSGQLVSLEAGFAQRNDTGKLTLQIEVNGKIEAEKTVSAGSAHIETELL
jgi:hypothetical protein